MSQPFFSRTKEIHDQFVHPESSACSEGIESVEGQPMKPMQLNGSMDCFGADVWNGWTDQKIRALEHQLCTVQDADNHLNIILRGTNNKFWQSSQCKDMLWSEWYTPGNLTLKQNANMTGRFFASRFGKDGQVVLFALGADGNLWDYWSSPSTIHSQPWIFKRLPMCAEPEFFALERHYGGVEVFAIGLDNRVWHSWTKNYDNDEWSQWESLGGWVSTGLFLNNNSEGYPELLANDPENAVWTIRHGRNGWCEWVKLGNAIRGCCGSAINAEGGMDVYGVGFDRKLYRITRPTLDGPWGQWECLGGMFNGLVGVATDEDCQPKVCMIGADRRLWMLKMDGAFEDMGGSLGFACVNTNLDGGVVVVGCGHDGNVFCRKV